MRTITTTTSTSNWTLGGFVTRLERVLLPLILICAVLVIGSCESAKLRVRAIDNENAAPVANADVFINGQKAGTSGSDGSLEIDLDDGDYRISASEAGISAGVEEVQVRRGQAEEVTIMMAPKFLGTFKEYEVTIVEAPEDSMKRTTETFRILVGGEKNSIVKLTDISYVIVDDAEGIPIVDLTDMLKIDPNGYIVPRDIAAFRSALFTWPDEVIVTASLADDAENIYQRQIALNLQ